MPLQVGKFQFDVNGVGSLVVVNYADRQSFDFVKPAQGAPWELAVSIDVSKLLGFSLFSETVASIIRVNSPTSPTKLFTSAPGVPYVWLSGMSDWFSNPLGAGDVTAMYFSSLEGAEAHVNMLILTS